MSAWAAAGPKAAASRDTMRRYTWRRAGHSGGGNGRLHPPLRKSSAEAPPAGGSVGTVDAGGGVGGGALAPALAAPGWAVRTGAGPRMWLDIDGAVGSERITAETLRQIAMEIREADARLWKLEANGLGLSRVPMELLQCGASPSDGTAAATAAPSPVRQLHLNGNQIAEVNPDIGALPHLRLLFLGRNLLRGLPRLPGSLTELSLTNNKLRSLPGAIIGCVLLEKL